VEEARARRVDAIWYPADLGRLRAAQPARVDLTPDAVLVLDGHVWYLELERSWSRATLEVKLRHYGLVWRYGLWRDLWPVAPRCLFVPTALSRADSRWEAWLSRLDAVRRQAVGVLPLAALGDTWAAWRWTADGHREAVDFWRWTAEPLPPPARRPPAALRRL